MKTFNYFKWKSIAKKIGVLGLTALMIASCGSDSDNKTNSSSSSSYVPVGTSPIFGDPNLGGSSASLNTWNSLKSATGCQQGRMEDLTLTLSGQSNGYQYGLQQGQISGTAQGSYFGKSQRGDLLFISKVSDGSGQVGHNIVVSFCTSEYNGIQFVGPNAQMSGFYAASIYLNDNGTCASGSITSGKIGFYTPSFGDTPIQFASTGQCY